MTVLRAWRAARTGQDPDEQNADDRAGVERLANQHASAKGD
jgi:hypothetical protein